MAIPLKSLWEYVGEDQPHCRNILHCVIDSEKEIVTWGSVLNFKRQTTMRAGDTWMGSEEEFLRNFKPAISGKPFSFV